MKENKRIRTVWKYHYETVQICKETDVIYTRCRVCKEYKPSDLKYFMKDTHEWKRREIQPLCRECHRKLKAERKIKEQQTIKVEAPHLFEETQEETIETKLDKVIAFFTKLGIK